VISAVISGDGKMWTVTLTSANFKALTRNEIQVSISNQNAGDGPYTMTAQLVSCGTLASGGNRPEVCARVADNSRRDITFSLLTTASSGSQSGEGFVSNDWKVGVTNSLDGTMKLLPSVMTLGVQGSSVDLVYSIGGQTITARMVEGT
jgi:hypothetical protein